MVIYEMMYKVIKIKFYLNILKYYLLIIKVFNAIN